MPYPSDFNDEDKKIVRSVQMAYQGLPDGNDKTMYMIRAAYSRGVHHGERNPTEAVQKDIRKNILLKLFDYLSRKRNSLSQVNHNDIQAIAIGWLDSIDLIDIYESQKDIAELSPEFLGLVMKHKMWADEVRASGEEL